jgi:apolipoprotein N-acyltransferase
VLQASWAFKTGQTFYTQYGDLFAMAASVLAALACLLSFARRGGDGAAAPRGARAGKKRK